MTKTQVSSPKPQIPREELGIWILEFKTQFMTDDLLLPSEGAMERILMQPLDNWRVNNFFKDPGLKSQISRPKIQRKKII